MLAICYPPNKTWIRIAVARVRRAAERKLAEVEHKIAALERVRSGLARLVAACPGHGQAKERPILKALGEESIQ